MSATPPLRYVRIAVILLLVSIILLFLRNNLIPLYQSSNFIWSLSNYLGSRTILLGIIACMFLFTSAGATDISLSDHLYIPFEASFVIFKDPNLSDNISILFTLCKLVLSSHGLHHIYFICLLAVTLPNCLCTNYYVLFSFCKISLLTLYQILQS